MAVPYSTDAVKTFLIMGGVAATDPKLLKKSTIDPTLADKWKLKPIA